MKKALVVVDFQVDFVEGALGFPLAKTLEPVIDAKIAAALEEGTDLVFTFDTHPAEGYLETREGRHLPVPHCIKGTPGHALYGRVARHLDRAVKVIEKDQFTSIELAEFLKDYDEVEFCGLVSNICVLSNVVLARAFTPEMRIVVDLKATLSFDPVVNSTLKNYLEGLHVVVTGD